MIKIGNHGLNKREVIVISLLALLLVLIFPATLIYRSQQAVDVTIDLTMSQAGVGQLFYDASSQYLEAKSRRFNLFSGRQQYHIRLHGISFEDVQTLRVDPGEVEQGSFIVHGIGITSGSREVLLSTDDLLAKMVPLNDLVVDPNVPMRFIISGTDPYFEVKIGSIANRLLLPFSPFLVGVVLWLIVSLGYITQEKWRERLRCNSLELAFVAVLFGCCLAIGVLIPPFQAPDEYSHVERAYFVAGGNFNLGTSEESIGVILDPALLEYGRFYANLPFHDDQRVTKENQQKAKQQTWSGREEFVEHAGTAPYMMPVYLPQALAFALGKGLNLNVDETYRLARFSVLIVSISLVMLAGLFSPLSPAVLVVISMPMMMFQFTAVTVDGFSVALALLVLSIFTNDQNHLIKKSGAVYGVMLVCMLVVLTSRPYMMPLLLLPGFMAYRSRSLWMWAGFLICTALSFGWILFGTTQATDLRVDVGESRSVILLYYILHPVDGLLLLSRTLEVSSQFYLESFIGNLGWLDTKFGPVFYSIATFVLFVFSLMSIQWSLLQSAISARVVLLVVAISSAMLVFIALLINWSEHPAQLIHGVQGRYFTIPLLVLLYSTSAMVSEKPSRFRSGLIGLAYLWLVFSTTSTIQLLLNRYWLA